MKKILTIVIILLANNLLYSQLPEKVKLGPLNLTKVSADNYKIGNNVFSFNVINSIDSLVNIYLSIRNIGTSKWQTARYFAIKAFDTITISKEYYIPDESYRLFKIKLGIPFQIQILPEEMGAKVVSNPVEHLIEKNFVEYITLPSGIISYWSQLYNVKETKICIQSLQDSLSKINQHQKDSIKSLLRWDRTGNNGFNSVKIKSSQVNNTIIETWKIGGDPNKEIGFIIMKREDLKPPFKTVLFMSGNPTGKKEDQVDKLWMLSDSGYRVVIIDRRESARRTEKGEFLENIANPVFDAKHLVDYLMQLDDTDKKSRISVIGFSQGAAEAQFLAALHDDVSVSILLNRMIDNDYLFRSWAWWPTLYNEDILIEIGADSVLTFPWEKQIESMSDELLGSVKIKYNEKYSFYDSKNILKLVAPKPILLITSVRDQQFPIEGVLSLDDEIFEIYDSYGISSAYNLYIQARTGHQIDAISLKLSIDYLNIWF